MMMGKPIDIVVGGRIRQRRAEMALSLEDLADRVETAPERLAAVEAGALRATARLLSRICRELDVPPQYFFEMEEDKVSPPDEGRKWMEALRRIQSPELREVVINFAHNVAQLRP